MNLLIKRRLWGIPLQSRRTNLILIGKVVLVGFVVWLVLIPALPRRHNLPLFSFVPPSLKKCEELFPRANKYRPFPYTAEWVKYKHESKLKGYELVERHCGEMKEQAMTFYHLAHQPWVKTICETGFHAGHSALYWLLANQKANVYSFDLGMFEYSNPMSEFIKSLYPGRFTVIWGDSANTLPSFIQSHPDVTCDLMLVDGGRTLEIVTTDIDNMRKIANQTRNILILNDYPSFDNLRPAWEDHIERNETSEFFHCEFRDTPEKRGFAVGEYIY